MGIKKEIENDLLELYEPEVLKMLMAETVLPIYEHKKLLGLIPFKKYIGLIIYRIEQEFQGKAFVITGIKGHVPYFGKIIKEEIISLARKNNCSHIRSYARKNSFIKFLKKLGFNYEETILRYELNG